jgi:hypothetical protein
VKLGEMHMFNKIKNSNQKFYVKNSLVEANSLAFAGEHVFIKSHFIEENDGEFIFQVNAKNENDRELGGVKITFKLDGEFKNGNAKYLAKITTNSGKVIFTGPACLTKDKVALFDESSLYEVQIEFEE